MINFIKRLFCCANENERKPKEKNFESCKSDIIKKNIPKHLKKYIPSDGISSKRLIDHNGQLYEVRIRRYFWDEEEITLSLGKVKRVPKDRIVPLDVHVSRAEECLVIVKYYSDVVECVKDIANTLESKYQATIKEKQCMETCVSKLNELVYN
jgi:hypothetical protein